MDANESEEGALQRTDALTAELQVARYERLHAQEMRLMGRGSFAALVQQLVYGIRSAFGVDTASLFLNDPSRDIRRILEDDGAGVTSSGGLLMDVEDETCTEIKAGAAGPIIGRFDASRHGCLFPDEAVPPTSIAILPLLRRGELLGSLNFGSRHPEHFDQTLGAAVLGHLAAVVALCLENALNRARLKHTGLTDPLTQVSNRRLFEQRFHEEVARALRQLEPLSCMVIDIDALAALNGEHGYQIGDYVLRETARRLKETLRDSDVIARYGGDELIILLPNTASDEALVIAERIRVLISATGYAAPESLPVQVTAAIGVATFQPAVQLSSLEPGSENLVATACRALSIAQTRGGNVVIATTE
jgi:two-component system cell cycle response regulator